MLTALRTASSEVTGRASGTFEGLGGKENGIFEEWREKALWLKLASKGDEVRRQALEMVRGHSITSRPLVRGFFLQTVGLCDWI